MITDDHWWSWWWSLITEDDGVDHWWSLIDDGDNHWSLTMITDHWRSLMMINFIYVVYDHWESIMLSLFSGDHNAIFSLVIITVLVSLLTILVTFCLWWSSVWKNMIGKVDEPNLYLLKHAHIKPLLNVNVSNLLNFSPLHCCHRRLFCHPNPIHLSISVDVCYWCKRFTTFLDLIDSGPGNISCLSYSCETVIPLVPLVDS